MAFLQPQEPPAKWFFFCESYLHLLDWEKRLGGLASRIPTSSTISEAAHQLRKPFLDLITAQGRVHASIAWWTSRVSERNTRVSPLFLNCCYLRAGQMALQNQEGRLCVIAESWAVMESLADTAARYGWSVEWVTRKNRVAEYLRFSFETAKRVTAFFGRALLQMLRDKPARPLDRPHILLRTWADETCLGQDGIFRDRYLPSLCQWLEARGYAVTTIPVLFNLKRTYRSAWKWLRDSNQNFLNPFWCYRPADYWFTFTQAWQQLAMPKGASFLGDLDVTRLFDEARRFHAWDGLSSILLYRLPRRLAERGISIALFIDLFENMIPAKPLILGFRRYCPETRLVGFQNGALPPNVLCLYVTQGESEFAPLPDRIVCNGPFFRDILIQEGLPADRVVAGPALRYQHLWSEAPQPEVAFRQGVFVPLPLMHSDAVELLTKLIQAFGAEPQITLSLKLHPMSSLTRLLDAARVSSLPQNFTVVAGDIGAWLARAQVVVALSTSALYEALAAGVPVVPVGRDTALDFNTLAWHPDFQRQYCSATEIREETLRLMQISAEELQVYRSRGRQILAESFGPVTDATLRSFIDGLLPAEVQRPPP